MSIARGGKIKNTEQKVDQKKFDDNYSSIKWKSDDVKKPSK